MQEYETQKGPLGNGKLLKCIPNKVGVIVIQVYDIFTLVFVFTLYRTVAACQMFKNTETVT